MPVLPLNAFEEAFLTVLCHPQSLRIFPKFFRLQPSGSNESLTNQLVESLSNFDKHLLILRVSEAN